MAIPITLHSKHITITHLMDTLDEHILEECQTQVQLMVSRLRQLWGENTQLKAMLAQAQAESEQLRQHLQQALDDYRALKTARMLAVSDTDIDAAKQRLASMIRDVDKCMAILAEQQ